MSNYTDATYFNKTVRIPLRTWTNNKEDKPPRTDFKHSLWVERGEDWYALISYARKYPGEAVRVVEREVWVRAREQQDYERREQSNLPTNGSAIRQAEEKEGEAGG